MSTMLKGDEVQVESSKSYAFIIAFVAAVGGFLFGYDLVIISGAQLFLKEQFALDAGQFGFATSSAILGCLIGPFVGMWLCDRIGRKYTLVFAAIMFGASAIGTALPKDIMTFNIFRIVGGVGVGLASVASPMYIAEVAPGSYAWQIGIDVSIGNMFGAVLSTVVAWILAKYLAETVSRRWMFGSELVPIIGFVIFLCMVPRSPRWLAEKGRDEEAFEVMRKIDGYDYAIKEMQEVKESLSEEKGTFSEILKPGLRIALLIGCMLAIFNQWTGWSGIAYYLPTIFEKAGWVEKSGSILQTMFVMGINIFWTVLAICLVDRWGRRPMWIATSACMIVAMFLPGLVFQLNITGPVVLVLIIICAAPHAIGLGALPWLVMAELTRHEFVQKAMAITTTVLWLAAFAAARFFPVLVEISEKKIGSIAGVFWMYALICILSLIFGIKLLPETKGRTLEEIAKSWTKE